MLLINFFIVVDLLSLQTFEVTLYVMIFLKECTNVSHSFIFRFTNLNFYTYKIPKSFRIFALFQRNMADNKKSQAKFQLWKKLHRISRKTSNFLCSTKIIPIYTFRKRLTSKMSRNKKQKIGLVKLKKINFLLREKFATFILMIY